MIRILWSKPDDILFIFEINLTNIKERIKTKSLVLDKIVRTRRDNVMAKFMNMTESILLRVQRKDI